MIRIENLYKTFYKAKTLKQTIIHPLRKKERVDALRGIDGFIERGKLYSLLGPNGAGKTTLLKIISTLILPNKGEVYVDGNSIYKDSNKIRSLIGLVQSDERSFYWRLSGRQNLEFYGTLQNIPKSDLKGRIDEVLVMLGLEEAQDRQFQTYSTGMRQKLAIARGLLHKPEIIILDEPTRSLDPVVAAQIRGFIIDDLIKKQGKTIILATHNLSEAESLSDKLAIINKGKIVAEGSVRELSMRFNQRIEVEFRFKEQLEGEVLKNLPSNAEYISDDLLLKCYLDKEEEYSSFLKYVLSILPPCEIEKKSLSLEEIFARLVDKNE